MAVAVGATGLDRRVGLLVLGKIKGVKSYCFIFFPLIAVTAGFFSEHALCAIFTPILVLVYMASIKNAGVKADPKLAAVLFLGLCFATNVGGSASPAVGGRAAIMVGYFADYGLPITFTQWMMYGLPIVPLLAIGVGAYLYFAAGIKVKGKFNISQVMKDSVKDVGPLSGKELRMAFLFAALIISCACSKRILADM